MHCCKAEAKFLLSCSNDMLLQLFKHVFRSKTLFIFESDGRTDNKCSCTTSSKRALMMVIQCLMVVMQSGWHTASMASPMPAALFTSTRFSSTVCMKSRCVCNKACKVSTSSGRTPRKRRVCSASESHSNKICTAVRNSSACEDVKGNDAAVFQLYFLSVDYYSTCVYYSLICLLFHLFKSLLETGLFRDRQCADRLPAVTELLQLDFDPGGVISARLHEVPGRTFQCLDVTGPFPQLLLKSLR